MIKRQTILKNTMLTDYVINDIDVNDELSNYLLLSDANFLPLSGGTVDGNLSVNKNLSVSENLSARHLYSPDVKILSGNYYQTNNEASVFNFNCVNSFIQAETESSYGIACVGTKGFHILKIIPEENALKLSGDLSILGQNNNNLSVYSFDFWSTAQVNFAKISAWEQTEASAGIAYLSTEKPLTAYFSAADLAKTEEENITQVAIGKNSMHCFGNPLIGNGATIQTTMYAEGSSVKAIGRYSHAEGRANVAGGRYTHAEGSRNMVLGSTSHAEGLYNNVYGNYSHVEGYGNNVYSDTSHAEGYANTVKGQYGHAEGYGNNCYGKQSHVAGGGNNVSGDYSYVCGIQVDSTANNQFMWNADSSTRYGNSNNIKDKAGCFAINPIGGLSNFFVGSKSMSDHLSSFEHDSIRNDVKSALSSIFNSNPAAANVSLTSVVNALSALYLKCK